MSLSVVPKVAELFCEDRFGDAAVGKVTGATGWDMEDEKQMKEVKRRVMDEEHGRTFDKLIEMIWITSKMNEVKHRYLWRESEGKANVARTRCSRMRCSMRRWTCPEDGF